MLADLLISNSVVTVIGGGTVAERKVRKLIRECPKIIVASKEFTPYLKKLQERRRVKLLKLFSNNEKVLERVLSRSSIVIVATNDMKLNGQIAGRAKRKGILVNAVDNPKTSNFNFPAIAKIGDIRIAVSTGGKSPAMAALLSRRLGKQVSKNDLLFVSLQSRVRKFASRKLPDPESRRRAVYSILNDERIHDFLGRNRVRDADKIAKGIVFEESRRALRE